MESMTMLALFRGGVADGRTKEITKIEDRLNWHSSIYLHQGEEETELFGLVQVYVLEKKEEAQRKKILNFP